MIGMGELDHLVMTITVCELEHPPIFKNGKPSFSMGHGLTMAMLVITRGYSLFSVQKEN